MEKTQKQLIQETHETVNTLNTVLLGVPGTDDKGLVGEVKQVKLNMKELYKRVWILWGIILAIVIVAGGIVTLVNGVSG